MSALLEKPACTLEEFDRVWAPSPHVVNELHELWVEMWDQLGLQERTGTFETVMARWSEPHRFHHTPRHLLEALRVSVILSPYCAKPLLVRFALCYHDIFSNPNQHDNEERSADLAEATFIKAGGSAEQAVEVRQNVIASIHRFPIRSVDAAVLADCDLAILGAPRERFDEYEHNVQREYKHVQKRYFAAGRIRALQPFLARKTLYRTPLLRQLIEDRAQDNLKHSIAQLQEIAAQ